ncbi:hypothetical protein IGI04_035857, partial [Brassica rapa subsp. trilocularis]
GEVFTYISSNGNFDVVFSDEFNRPSEMRDSRVDLMIEMHRKKYNWTEEEAGEASENEMEEEIESTHVSAATKRKNKFQDTGAESRKKRLLCQRSTEKIENLTRPLYQIRGEVLSSQTAHAAPASNPSHFATPASTGDAGATPASTHALASDSTRARAPTANQASTHTSAPATSRRRAPAPSCSGAPTLSHTCGPASSAKIRSQTKDPELSDVFGSLFDTLNVNLGTQEHLQKTMGNLTQESHVNGFDPSQEKQSEEPSAFTTPITSFRPEIFNHHS